MSIDSIASILATEKLLAELCMSLCRPEIPIPKASSVRPEMPVVRPPKACEGSSSKLPVGESRARPPRARKIGSVSEFMLPSDPANPDTLGNPELLVRFKDESGNVRLSAPKFSSAPKLGGEDPRKFCGPKPKPKLDPKLENKLSTGGSGKALRVGALEGGAMAGTCEGCCGAWKGEATGTVLAPL